jgi:hypothetical protein
VEAQTTARVKTALVNDPELGLFAIEVRVIDGVAHLTGRVRSRDQAERAEDITREVSGVTGVASALAVGDEPAPPQPDRLARRPPPNREMAELESGPSLFAAGATVGWSLTVSDQLERGIAIGPLVRFGVPHGLGPTIGFDWFRADIESVEGLPPITRVNIRPIMAGIGYTRRTGSLSVTPSIVAGYAFNSLTITDTGIAENLPVEVSNSFVWRVGLSAWFDTSRRTAVNLSAGYLMTGLGLTVLDGQRLTRREASGNTAIVHAGLAYRIF